MKSITAPPNIKSHDLLPLIGIGASAGGLSALKILFSEVPEDSGLSFVVVVHLSPEHKSMLAEILQPHTKMTVQQVTKTIKLNPGHVYIIPPNSNINAIDTHLRLSKLEEERSQRAPIDNFFRTLAETHKEKAAGIILTGTGNDGTLGLKEIKDKGGLTIAQDPKEAEYESMPQSAIDTGHVDKILPLMEIPSYIIKYFSTKPKLSIPKEGQKPEKQQQNLLHKIISQIKAHSGRDFSQYKITTLMRRIHRRMQLYQVEKLSDYHEILRKDPEEVDKLSDEFLINVTNFFRDTNVFEQVGNKVIPEVLKNKKENKQIRIWSVGCATGEEAYSLAILIEEAFDKLGRRIPVQIFASDLHAGSLKKARTGFFPGDINKDVSPDRIKRFFIKEDSGYRIRKELREQVVFVPHNLLADPPFSRLDIVVCRNLMIYLKKEIQKDILKLFHYALLPDGYLVLGTAESLEEPELFNTMNKKLSIFQKNNVTAPESRLPIFASTYYNNYEKTDQSQMHEHIPSGAIHQKAVERYGPPSLLLNMDNQVLHISETVGRYLVLNGGQPSYDIFKLIRNELQLELRTAIHMAKERKKIVRSRPVVVTLEGKKQKVFISARTVREAEEENHILIFFEEYENDSQSTIKEHTPEDSQKYVQQIEEYKKELQGTREQIRVLVEEYENSREEMKASNEELQSSNEELRSTMEELETSKEELQSMNEELSTLNQENRQKVEELRRMSDDLQNLFAATDIATLFLDREMHILRFTPKSTGLFNIRQTDRGRLISDVTHNLGDFDLIKDAKKVLKDLQSVNKEVPDKEGNTYQTKIFPYRSREDKIEGVVVTFVDITERKRMENELLKAKVYAESIIETLNEPLLVLHSDLTVKSANPAFYDHFKVNEKETAGKLIYNLGKGQWDIPKLRELLENVLPDNKVFNDFEVEHEFNHIGQKTMLVNARRLDHVQLILLGIRDITKRKEEERILKKAKTYAENVAKTKEDFLAHMSHEIRTPLNSIIGHSYLLLKKPYDKNQKKDLKNIKISANYLNHLINDILDYSKIKSGIFKVTQKDVSFYEYIDDLVKVYRSIAEEKELDLEVDIDKNIPENILLDPSKLYPVIRNLLDNAIKYTKDGKVRLEVTLHNQKNKNLRLEFRVSDTGMGIPKKELQNIFTDFYQVDKSTKKAHKGTGLGLAIVKNYLSMMDSKINVESKFGKGTSFWFILSVVQGRKKSKPENKSEEKAIASDRKNIKILIVDDDNFNLMMLGQMLSLWGIKYDQAKNGKEALELAVKNDYDIMYIDIHMPGIDGIETARRIRGIEKYQNTPIFALTADVTDSIDSEIKSGLFVEKISKPFDPEDLRKKINEIERINAM